MTFVQRVFTRPTVTPQINYRRSRTKGGNLIIIERSSTQICRVQIFTIRKNATH
jgi:hypothetical protein